MGCCALYLGFGFVAGMDHVHESAGHHEESRGLHLDHGHLSSSGDHDHQHHDRTHGGTDERAPGFDARHASHHDDDAVYLNATATRSVDPGARLAPAIVSAGTVVDPPSSRFGRDEAMSGSPRDPPRKIPPRLRGPPA